MSTAATLLARKQQLMQEMPGPHERDEIERLLAQIDAALNLLDEATMSDHRDRTPGNGRSPTASAGIIKPRTY